MKRIATRLLAASLLLLGILAWPMFAEDPPESPRRPDARPGAGDAPLATEPAPSSPGFRATDRTIYVPKNASALALHGLLEKHFAEDERVKFVVEPVSNLLSIRATSPAAMEEVLATLGQIDKPVRTIDVTIFLVEFPALPKDIPAHDEPAKPPVDLGVLTGTAADTVRQVQLWMKNGQVSSLRRFDMRTIENTPSQLLLGEQKPVPTGAVNARRGPASPVLTIRDFGISFDVTSRITETGDIMVSLVFRDSLLGPADQGADLGQGENGPIVVPTIATRHLSTTLQIPNGRSSMATGFEPGPGSGHANAGVVVSARIAERGARTTESAGPPSGPVGQSAGPESSRTPLRGPGAGFGVSREDPSDPQRAGRRSSTARTLYLALQEEEFLKRVALSEEQQSQIEKLRSETNARLRGIGQPDGSGTRNPTDLGNVFRQFEENASMILTEQQLKIWADWKQELARKRREFGGGTQPPPAQRPNE